jgi:hypothetical protein
MVLVSHRDDPVLAVWQYGLGRVVAWTSDALGLWTSHWLQWNQAAQWWANLVTWTLPTANGDLNISGQIVDGSGQITVDVPITQTNTQQQVTAHIIAPDRSQQTINLQPSAPQRWQGRFSADPIGTYVLQVTWQGTTSKGVVSRLTATTGIVVPYSPEFRTQGTDMAFLKLLAQDGGGTLLNINNSSGAFQQNLIPVSVSLPITFLLLALAALLLPIDIAARRLSNLESLVVAWKWLLMHLRPSKFQLATTTDAIKDGTIGATLDSVRLQREERRIRAQPLKPLTSNKETATVRQGKTQTAKAQSPQKEMTTMERLLEDKRKRVQEEEKP